MVINVQKRFLRFLHFLHEKIHGHSCKSSTSHLKNINVYFFFSMKRNKLIEVAVKMLVAALTAFLTALTTTSCMGELGLLE